MLSKFTRPTLLSSSLNMHCFYKSLIGSLNGERLLNENEEQSQRAKGTAKLFAPTPVLRMTRGNKLKVLYVK